MARLRAMERVAPRLAADGRTGRRGGTAMTRMVELIRSEAEGIQAAWAAAGVGEVRTPGFESYCLTMSALNQLQARLSPGRCWLLEAAGTPPQTTLECLAAAAGICGNQAQAMVDVMRALGGEAREKAQAADLHRELVVL